MESLALPEGYRAVSKGRAVAMLRPDGSLARAKHPSAGGHYTAALAILPEMVFMPKDEFMGKLALLRSNMVLLCQIDAGEGEEAA